MKESEYLETLARLIAEAWPEGIAREVHYPRGEMPVSDYLRAGAREHPEKTCVLYYGYELSYGELDELSDRLATYLASRGLERGDRVGVFLYNSPQYFIAFHATLKLGCVHVPINPMFREEELRYELEDATPKVLLAMDRLYGLAARVAPEAGVEEILATRFADFLPAEPTLPLPALVAAPEVDCPGATDLRTVLHDTPADPPAVALSLDDPASLNYTGGTTGMPKGCIHTQRNMLYSCCAFASANPPAPPGTPEGLGLSFAPSFWIAGQLSLIAPILQGGTVVYLTRWDATTVLEAIERYGVTSMSGPLDVLVELMEHPNLARYDLSSLRSVTCSSFVKRLNVEYRRRFAALTGLTLRESSYGMTETHTCDCFTVGMQAGDMDLESPVFVGLPVAGTRFKITSFDTGEVVPLGESGEITIDTPSLMKGYWNAPEKTAREIQDGWFHTGDIGMIDERGYLHYLGRRKEMLKVKGMSVFPVEIENLLGRHPAIEGSAVLGRPDRERGEVPVAFVKLRPEHVGRVTAQELAAWCRESMAVYKQPEVHLVEEFPLTETGKIKKEVLRRQQADLLSRDRAGS